MTLSAFGVVAVFIAFALYIPTRQKLDIANAELEHATAPITTLQTGNEALDSATLARMSLHLKVWERVNG